MKFTAVFVKRCCLPCALLFSIFEDEVVFSFFSFCHIDTVKQLVCILKCERQLSLKILHTSVFYYKKIIVNMIDNECY